MADLPLFSKDGQSTGTISVDETVFGEKVRKKLLHQVVLIHRANQRQGTAHTKTRGEVKGSIKKLWPQKHTGMARMGTKRSPIWRKGGVVFGPRHHEYRQGITTSMKREALNSALLGKIRGKNVSVIEAVEFEKPGTKAMATLIKTIGFKRSVLLAVTKPDRNAYLSSRNLKDVVVRPVADLHAYEILRYRDVLFTKEAMDVLVAARKKNAKSKSKAGEKKS